MDLVVVTDGAGNLLAVSAGEGERVVVELPDAAAHVGETFTIESMSPTDDTPIEPPVNP